MTHPFGSSIGRFGAALPSGDPLTNPKDARSAPDERALHSDLPASAVIVFQLCLRTTRWASADAGTMQAVGFPTTSPGCQLVS
jgi:hypothetical protein